MSNCGLILVLFRKKHHERPARIVKEHCQKTSLVLSCILCTSLCFAQLDLTFQNYSAAEGLPVNTRSHAIVQAADGMLWIATYDGLFYFDGNTVSGVNKDTEDLIGEEVMVLYRDRDDRIWISSWDKGVFRYDPATGNFKNLNQSNATGVQGFVQDQYGNVWGAGYGVLHMYDHQTDSLHLYPASEDMTEFQRTFQCVITDPSDKDVIWVGTRAGLFSFDRNTSSFELHRSPYVYKEGREHGVLDGYFDSNGILWHGIWGGGIIRYDPAEKLWDRYYDQVALRRKDGWFNISSKILPIGDQIWIASSNGLGYYDITRDTFEFAWHTRGYPNSLLPSTYYEGLILTDQGNLVVSGFNGISVTPVIFPESLTRTPVLYSIAFDDEGKINSPDGQVEMTSDQDSLSILFGLPNFDPNLEVLYSYRLVPFQGNWSSPSKDGIAVYTNLPKGEYTFEYRASVNGQDIYGKDNLSIKRQVPYYKRTWFYGLCLLAVAIIVIVFQQVRIRSIKTAAKLKKDYELKLAEVEMSALRAQMNPHFMFNSLNSIRYYILNEESDKADEYLTKFSQLMRGVLVNSKSKLVALQSELDVLRLYIELESLRFTNGFNFDIAIDDSIDSESTLVPPLLIQPYVENAIWHGLLQKDDAGNLLINCIRRNDNLEIIVEDDGIGRMKAQELKSKSATARKSMGMQITNDRISLVQQALGIDAYVEIEDLNDGKGHPTGTRVKIVLPILLRDSLDSKLTEQ